MKKAHGCGEKTRDVSAAEGKGHAKKTAAPPSASAALSDKR